MTGSDELLLKIKPLEDRGLLRTGADDAVVNSINERFPFIGSKIDWGAIPGSIVKRLSSTDEMAECISFMADCLKGMEKASPVVIIGDGVMQFKIETNLSNIECCFYDVLELPQHTYITTPLCEWCLVFTMEGDMCFGYAPPIDLTPVASN